MTSEAIRVHRYIVIYFLFCLFFCLYYFVKGLWVYQRVCWLYLDISAQRLPLQFSFIRLVSIYFMSRALSLLRALFSSQKPITRIEFRSFSSVEWSLWDARAWGRLWRRPTADRAWGRLWQTATDELVANLTALRVFVYVFLGRYTLLVGAQLTTQLSVEKGWYWQRAIILASWQYLHLLEWMNTSVTAFCDYVSLWRFPISSMGQCVEGYPGTEFPTNKLTWAGSISLFRTADSIQSPAELNIACSNEMDVLGQAMSH